MKVANQITVSREQLYDLVWAEPMIKVAARFQISDVGLKKRCLKERIPVPGRGYWRQIETGKKVPKRPALPKVSNASPITFFIFERASEAEPMSTIDPAFVEYEAAHPIIIADELQRPSPEAKAVLRDLKGQKPDEYGAIRSRQPNTFQVRIHPSSNDRVILLVDAVAKACRDRGFTFADGRPGSRYWEHLAVVVDGVSLYLVFEERMRRISYRMAAEQQAVETLEADARAWERAERLRGYIREVEGQMNEPGTITSKLEWLEWARQQADRIDPLVTSPPSILDTPEEEYRDFSIWQMPDD